MEPFVITSGRQLGAGGRAIGHFLAKEFDMDYYDKEILAVAAKESGYSEDIFEKNDEKKGFFGHAFRSVIPMIGTGEYYNNSISEEALFRLQSDAILKAANAHSSVFIGRVADYVLRNNPRCINIFLTANYEDRISRVIERHNVDRKVARRLLEKGESQRAEFYNFYSSRTWGEADTYHLCLNTSVLGIEKSGEIIKEFVKTKFGL